MIVKSLGVDGSGVYRPRVSKNGGFFRPKFLVHFELHIMLTEGRALNYLKAESRAENLEFVWFKAEPN